MLVDQELVKKAKEELGDDNEVWMADILGLQSYDLRTHKSLCPFHEEETPSFIYNKKNYSFHCFGSCGRSFDIIDAIMIKEGKTYVEAVKMLFERTKTPYSFGEIGVRTKSQYRYPMPKYSDSMNNVYEYMAQRGISKETCDYLQLKEDHHGNILIQYFDTNDVLTMVKVRPSRKIQHGETKIWCLSDEKGNAYGTIPILYNMNRINVSSPLLICCGEFDCAAAIESGFSNSVSIPLGDSNTHWIDECFEWLDQFNEIIICADNDDSGEKFKKSVIPRLENSKCKIVDVPKYFIREDVRKIPIKDLNDVLVRYGKEKVMEIINAAYESPIPSVIDFSDVEDLDLSDIDGIYTGIKPMDKEIMRLFFGSLTILSGIPGAGKTSYLYQLVCSALEQGYDSWIFSRELPASMTRNWMNFLLAGNRHIKEYKGENDSVYYKVTPEAKKAIGDHYRGRLFLYRDDYNNDVELLKTSMISVAKRNGCKLFIIDNLTTVSLGGDEKSQFTKQTDFVNWLVQFGFKYNVATILVVHPHKLERSKDGKEQELSGYDLSGSANIINLAHRAIGLSRIKPDDENPNGKSPLGDVKAVIIKDRMRGRSGSKFYMRYDVPSRRFYTDYEEYDRQYAWDKNKYDTRLPFRQMDSGGEVFDKR